MNSITRICLSTIALVFITGCSDESASHSHNETEVTNDGHDHAHDHGHDHGSDGPHGGHILGLGDEEYHLEWLHNDAGKLTFYLLDATAKEDVTTTTNSITIETTVKYEIKSVTLNSTTPDAETHNCFEAIDPVYFASSWWAWCNRQGHSPNRETTTPVNLNTTTTVMDMLTNLQWL